MQSFWQQYPAVAFPPLSGTVGCDVAIIGGGYTGSWLAYFLRDAGLNVVVLEAHQPGYGASGRNGGLLLQGPADLLGKAAQDLGEDVAIEFWHKTRETFEWVKTLARRHPIDFHPTGSLYLGARDERTILEATASLMNQHGVAAQLWPHAEQPASLQNLNLDLALWVPDDAMIHPVKLIDALLAEASSQGVHVYGQSPVLDCVDHSTGATLRGPDFVVDAAVAVTATNAYLPAWLTALEPYIQPVRGQMLATEPIARLDHDYPVYADHGFNYWHQRRDGRLIAGGFRHLDLAGEIGTELVLHQAIQDALAHLVNRLSGQPVSVAARWSGIMAMSPDHRPYVGRISSHVLAALGYSGHGSTVTPIAARMLADLIIDGTPVFGPMQIERLSRPADQTES